MEHLSSSTGANLGQSGQTLLTDVFAEHLLRVAHNAKFDASQYFRANGVLLGELFCTQIAEQVLRGVGLEDARVQGVELSSGGSGQEAMRFNRQAGIQG